MTLRPGERPGQFGADFAPRQHDGPAMPGDAAQPAAGQIRIATRLLRREANRLRMDDDRVEAIKEVRLVETARHDGRLPGDRHRHFGRHLEIAGASPFLFSDHHGNDLPDPLLMRRRQVAVVAHAALEQVLPVLGKGLGQQAATAAVSQPGEDHTSTIAELGSGGSSASAKDMASRSRSSVILSRAKNLEARSSSPDPSLCSG